VLAIPKRGGGQFSFVTCVATILGLLGGAGDLPIFSGFQVRLVH
jgi:hypothetical protein